MRWYTDRMTARKPAAPANSTLRPTVRYTIELDRAQHRALRIAALDLGADASAIVRALLAELEIDPELQRRVAGRVSR